MMCTYLIAVKGDGDQFIVMTGNCL